MTAKNRIAVIKDAIYRENRVTVSDLSGLCDVTEETIRKDLDKLQAEGFATRVHGGAVLSQPVQHVGLDFNQRRNSNLREKRMIARNAVNLLKGKNIVFADSSTTVAETLKNLSDDEYITIVSNSAQVFINLGGKNVYIISTGGVFNQNTMSMQGPVAKENIAKYNADVALISCKALDMGRGVQDSNESEAEIKKLMIDNASEVILLADHTKIGRQSLVRLMGLERVNYLVLDEKPPEEIIRYCGRHDIELIF